MLNDFGHAKNVFTGTDRRMHTGHLRREVGEKRQTDCQTGKLILDKLLAICKTGSNVLLLIHSLELNWFNSVKIG